MVEIEALPFKAQFLVFINYYLIIAMAEVIFQVLTLTFAHRAPQVS